MKKILFAAIAVVLSLSLCGCAAVLIGAGVAGGYAISKDTAKIERDTSYGHAWSAASKVVEGMGVVSKQDKDAGKIEATVGGSSVVVTVSQVSNKKVMVMVKARKNMLPNMDLAMEIIDKIGAKL